MYARYSRRERIGPAPLLAVARAVCPPGGVVEIWEEQGLRRLEAEAMVGGVRYWCVGDAGVMPDVGDASQLGRAADGAEAAFLAWSSLAGDGARRVALGAGSDIAAAAAQAWTGPFDTESVAVLRLLGKFVQTANAVLYSPHRAYFFRDDVGWVLSLRIGDRYAIKACTINDTAQFYEEKEFVTTGMLPTDVRRLFGNVDEPGADLESVILWAIRLVVKFAGLFPPQG